MGSVKKSSSPFFLVFLSLPKKKKWNENIKHFLTPQRSAHPTSSIVMKEKILSIPTPTVYMQLSFPFIFNERRVSKNLYFLSSYSKRYVYLHHKLLQLDIYVKASEILGNEVYINVFLGWNMLILENCCVVSFQNL